MRFLRLSSKPSGTTDQQSSDLLLLPPTKKKPPLPHPRLLLKAQRSSTVSTTASTSTEVLPPTPAESFTEDDDDALLLVVPLDHPGRTTPLSRSLGVGSFRHNKVVSLEDPPELTRTTSAPDSPGNAMLVEESSPATPLMAVVSAVKGLPPPPVLASSPSSVSVSSSSSMSSSIHYLRVTDLMVPRKGDASDDDHDDSTADPSSSSASPLAAAPPLDSPPWVWLGCAVAHTPAIDALARTGWEVAMNPSLWTLASPSALAPHLRRWHDDTFARAPVSECAPTCLDEGRMLRRPPVLVWTGHLHGMHRSDLPAVRAAALLPSSPETLLALLLDSNRVKEYNPHSLGREDLHVFGSSTDGRVTTTITKVMRSSTRPPLVRKTLSFTVLLHARPVEGGYLMVTRSVSSGPDPTAPPNNSSCGEILLSVTLLLRDGNRQHTRMVAVNHLHAPLIPSMLAKRIGVQAAANFLTDLQHWCEKEQPDLMNDHQQERTQ